MRVVVAEDHVLLRAGIVVLDIRMPPTHTLEGLRAAETIRSRHGTAIGILLLSQYVETRHAIDLLAGGAAGIGYLLKDRVLDPVELTDAVRRVGTGGSAIDPLVIEHLLKRRQADSPLDTLTAHEREVLAGMAEGRSNQSIARALHISERTVEACTGRIFTKLGLEPGVDDHRRVRAVLTYLQSGTETAQPDR